MVAESVRRSTMRSSCRCLLPGTGGSGIQRGDGQLSGLETAFGHDLAAVARIDLQPGLARPRCATLGDCL